MRILFSRVSFWWKTSSDYEFKPSFQVSWVTYVILKAKATVFHKWWTPKTNENSDKFVYFEFGVFWRGNVSFCGTLYPTGIFHWSVDVWWSALYSIPLQSRRFCLHINSDVDNYCCGPICCHHLSIPGSNAGKGWLMYFCYSNSATSLTLLLWAIEKWYLRYTERLFCFIV